MTDYRDDGLDLGSDASSRSSSASDSSKLTPCSECKSSPSLEDSEEDSEPNWDGRSLAEELEEGPQGGVAMDWAALERHLAGLQFRERRACPRGLRRSNSTHAQKSERESIRQKLALGNFLEEGADVYNGCSRSGKPSLSSRLQSGMNLQICFVNDSSSDKDSDADNSLDTPLSPTPSERDSDSDFLSRQRKLQAEATLALAMAKPMARMQLQVEKQKCKKSPVADLLPHLPHIGECLMRRSLKRGDLRDMTLGQMQVIVNDLHSQIEGLNEELVQLLLMRDELQMEQDAMLVDVEDLTSESSLLEILLHSFSLALRVKHTREFLSFIILIVITEKHPEHHTLTHTHPLSLSVCLSPSVSLSLVLFSPSLSLSLSLSLSFYLSLSLSVCLSLSL